MGLPLSHAPLFAQAIAQVQDRRACLFLGDQQIHCTEEQARDAYRDVLRDLPDRDFDSRLKLSLIPRLRERNMISCKYFARLLGFKDADVVDIDDRGFVNIVHDLNLPDLKAKTSNVYDIVFDGGTLEHVFSVENSMKNIGECTATDGIVIHLVPMNNFINHGFFQISPTLFFDYYGWNKWDVLLALYVVEREDGVHAYKANAKEFSGADMEFPDGKFSTLFVARKTVHSTVGVIPTQGMYAARMKLPREIIELK
jgi:SAM-dependent methyltransferase